MADNELLQLIYNDMQTMKADMQTMKADMQTVKTDIQTMKGEIRELNQRVSNLEKDVTDIKLTLENEIRVNIQRVAEGHLDLSRNLHDAMRPSSEVEMLAIKVRYLESEVREIKRKIPAYTGI